MPSVREYGDIREYDKKRLSRRKRLLIQRPFIKHPLEVMGIHMYIYTVF